MYYHVVDAKYKKEYQIWVKFEDGLEGELDFCDELDGSIFEPLKDINFFKSFNLEGKTLHWENGADFAPEYLYDLLKRRDAESA